MKAPAPSAEVRFEAIPHGRENAVRALVRKVRQRLFTGLPLPTFGREPADFLVALRRNKSQ